MSDDERTIVIARIVADHWRRAALDYGGVLAEARLMAHPLSLVLSALAGETDPATLGVVGGDAEEIARLATAPNGRSDV